MPLALVRRLVKGTALTAAEHDGNLNVLETAIEAPAIRGQVSRTSVGAISIASQGDYQSTGLTGSFDTATGEGLALGTTDTFAIKNTSGATKLLQFYASIDAAAGNNQTLGIKLAKNGTPVDQTECRAFTGSGGQEAKLVTNWIIEVANNDEVALFVANISASTNLELRRARIVATEVR
jgi:hypothetical protein